MLKTSKPFLCVGLLDKNPQCTFSVLLSNINRQEKSSRFKPIAKFNTHTKFNSLYLSYSEQNIVYCLTISSRPTLEPLIYSINTMWQAGFIFHRFTVF